MDAEFCPEFFIKYRVDFPLLWQITAIIPDPKPSFDFSYEGH